MMGQQQMNQLNSMHMMMNGHMMNMQQPNMQGQMLHQQNMLNPAMAQINATQFSTQQAPHPPQPPQQQAVLLVSNLNSEVWKKFQKFKKRYI